VAAQIMGPWGTVSTNWAQLDDMGLDPPSALWGAGDTDLQEVTWQ